MNKSTEKIKILTLETKISTIFKQYPSLKDYILSKKDKVPAKYMKYFSIINTPMFDVAIKFATVGTVSKKSGKSIENIQKRFDNFLKTLDKE